MQVVRSSFLVADGRGDTMLYHTEHDGSSSIQTEIRLPPGAYRISAVSWDDTDGSYTLEVGRSSYGSAPDHRASL